MRASIGQTVTGGILLFGLLMTACAPSTNEESPTTGGSSFAFVSTAAYGVVRHPDGTPAANVMVTATSTDDPPLAVPELAVMTDDRGAYEWPLKPGHYRLSAATTEGATTAEDATVAPGERARVDLDLQP